MADEDIFVPSRYSAPKKQSADDDIFAPSRYVAPKAKKPTQPDAFEDHTSSMSTLQKGLAGVGAAYNDLASGGKQLLDIPAKYLESKFKDSGIAKLGNLFGMPTAESSAAQTQRSINQARQDEAPLMKTGAGQIGKIAGSLALTAPTMLVPGLNTYTGAALIGGGMGALTPTLENESKLANTGLGAAGGLLGQGVSNGLGRLVSPVKSNLTGEQSRLAQQALDAGIPLNAADMTGNKTLKTLNSIFSTLPLTSGKQGAQDALKQTAFNRAVMAKAGENADNVSPEIMEAAFKRTGGAIGDISKRNTMKVDDTLLGKFADIERNYSNVLEPNQRDLISRNMDAVISKAPSMAGETYQSTRSLMGRLGNTTNPEFGRAAKDTRFALDDAFKRSISADDAAAFSKAQQQYGNLSTIANAMKSAGATSGDIPAAQLRSAVANANPRNFVQGKGDLNDLARIGETFLRDKTPNSGTAQRLALQGLMGGGAGGLGYMATENPAGAGAAALVGLLGPRGVQMAINNPAIRNYLQSSAGRETLAQIIQQSSAPIARTVAPAGLLSYMGQ